MDGFTLGFVEVDVGGMVRDGELMFQSMYIRNLIMYLYHNPARNSSM